MRKMRKEESIRDVVNRLDALIALVKLIYSEPLKRVRRQITSDPVFRAILELADGTREYSTLAEDVSRRTGKHVRTVKAKISKLLEIGVLRTIRQGKRVYYVNTGILD